MPRRNANKHTVPVTTAQRLSSLIRSSALTLEVILLCRQELWYFSSSGFWLQQTQEAHGFLLERAAIRDLGEGGFRFVAGDQAVIAAAFA